MEQLKEMEKLLNEYYENIDDPFATTDIAMEIIENVDSLIKHAKIGTHNEKALVNQERSSDGRIERLEQQNKRYREAIDEIKEISKHYRNGHFFGSRME